MNEENALELLEPPQIMDSPTVLEQLTRGEVDMQVATAKRWPRSIAGFRRDAMAMAVKSPEVARQCFYVLPRGGKSIDGPSVRLAEIVAVTWGNLRCESRVVEVGEKTITAQATAWDMQSNVLVRKECARRITDKHGKRYNDDMVVVTGNAAASVALRNAIFTVVPRAYVSDIFEHCKRVAAGDRGSLDQAKADWVKWFGSRGIRQEQVLELLGRKGLEDVSLEDITTLQGLSTALAEGETTLEDLFGPPTTAADGVRKFGFKARQEAKEAAKAAAAEADAKAATEAAPSNEKAAKAAPGEKEGSAKAGK